MRPLLRRALRGAGFTLAFLAVVALLGYLASADVRYLARAGVAEAGILWRRRPITEVVADSTTDAATRGKLLLVLAARNFAADSLGLAAGETYTTYSTLDRDTLVLVLSASRSDRLVSFTWTYPIVGRVPYKGFFDFALAGREAAKLERAGLDTYLRPAGAFSTLGWFDDPLLSTVVEEDSVELAATVIHEITHNSLYVRGWADFNESMANFVGYRGAEAFFRSRGDERGAARAAARWRDEMRLSRFFDALAARLDVLYGGGATPAAIRAARIETFRLAADQLAAATFETVDGPRLARRPLNNAVLMARRVYLTRLGDFDAALAAEQGDVRRAIAALMRLAARGGDPWAALPRAVEGVTP